MFFDKSDKVTNVNYNPCCSTSAKYSAPGNHGTRLMLVNEVALGNIKVGEIRFAFAFLKDGAYYCYCAYVLRISRYSDFLSPMVTNTGIFLRGLKLSGESRS